MHFTEYDTRLAAYAVLVDEADRILLTWFNGGPDRLRPGWSLPGGGVDFDEGIEDAVVRETHEETGYVVEVEAFLGAHHSTWPPNRLSSRPYRAQRFLFRARVVSGELGTLESGGTTDFARWVALADLPLREHTADIVDLAVEHVRLGRVGDR